MAPKTHRPELSPHRRMYGEDAGEFAATWFVFAGLVLSAILIFFVYAGGPDTEAAVGSDVPADALAATAPVE